MTLAETLASRLEAGIATADDLALAARAVRAAGAGRPVLALMADAARARRDNLLVDLWRQHFADRSPHAAAHALADLLRRYEATGWRHDRLRASPPGDALRRLEFGILSTGSAPAWRTIFDVLQRQGARLQSDPETVWT